MSKFLSNWNADQAWANIFIFNKCS